VRVVFLTHNYPRHPGDIAGAFLHPLATALACVLLPRMIDQNPPHCLSKQRSHVRRAQGRDRLVPRHPQKRLVN